ncbi:MAG: DUF2145 domain-containing protein [Burkholderiaceae bacterium]
MKNAVAARRGRRAATLLAAGLSWLGVLPAAHAGQDCEAKPLTLNAITQAMAMAQRTSAALDAEHGRSGARVVVLARAGQDLSRYRLRYSHLGWAYKTPEGPWRVLHKLNACGTDTSALYRQGLGEFFMDNPWRYQAAWAVVTPNLQDPLYALVTDPQRSVRLNTPAYSMVSYAWGTRYQQSNQWALETLAMAAEPGITSRSQAQAWLQFKGYEPSALRINALTRLGARMSKANVAFDDHPNGKRFSDRIETVTVDSVFAWLVRAGLASNEQVLGL